VIFSVLCLSGGFRVLLTCVSDSLARRTAVAAAASLCVITYPADGICYTAVRRDMLVLLR
jgi:hypothetical protein